MGTIYVDKHTALETINSALRIRHHSEHMQIQTTLERARIQSVTELKPQSVESSLPSVIAIKTVDEQVLIIPVWSNDDVAVMIRGLNEFINN